MSRHAYLIMAHSRPEQLKKLIRLLDDERNDIYVHIDKNAEGFPVDKLVGICSKSGLTMIERIPVLWGEYSLVHATYNLLKVAKEHEPYKYYHLMSGMDLPIKTQDQIHEFFDSRDSEFVDISSADLPYHSRYTKAVYPLLKIKGYRSSKLLRSISEVFARLQLAVGYDYQKKHNANNWTYADGWTWWSITDDMASYVIKNESAVHEALKNAKAPDEFFVSTLAYNSDYAEKINSRESHEKATMRLIDWKRGKPYIYKSDDFDELIRSPYMFARKFDEQVDSKIIGMIVEHLQK